MHSEIILWSQALTFDLWPRELTFSDSGVAAAQPVSLLAVAVQPDAEHHENDPAGGADARDERRLAHHVRDLLGNGVLHLQRRKHSARRIWKGPNEIFIVRVLDWNTAFLSFTIQKWIMDEKMERQPTKPSPLFLTPNIKENLSCRLERNVILLTVSCGRHFHLLRRFYFFSSCLGQSWIALLHLHRVSSVPPVCLLLARDCISSEAGAGQVRGLQRCEKAHGVTNAFEASVLGFRHVFLSWCKAQRGNGWMEAHQSLRFKFNPRSTRLKEEADCFTIFIVDVCVWGYSSNLYFQWFGVLGEVNMWFECKAWHSCHPRWHQVLAKNMSSICDMIWYILHSFQTVQFTLLWEFKCDWRLIKNRFITHCSPWSIGTTPTSITIVFIKDTTWAPTSQSRRVYAEINF